MANPSFIHVLTLSLLFFTSMHSKGIVSASDAVRCLPAASAIEYRRIDAQAAGEPFQLCLDCKCCAPDDPRNCSQMPCCYHIDCNLPDKPYGVCAFVPKSCDCTDCT